MKVSIDEIEIDVPKGTTIHSSSDIKVVSCILNYSKKMFLFKNAFSYNDKKLKTADINIMFNLRCI